MSSIPGQPPTPVRCGVTTSLIDIEAAKLRGVSRQVPAMQTSLRCEIAAGHDGSHVAFATSADDGELWWWLCWTGQTRDVRQIAICDGRCLDDPYLDDCLLFDGHPGVHSFDLRNGQQTTRSHQGRTSDGFVRRRLR
jgi:hypothetical protein